MPEPAIPLLDVADLHVGFGCRLDAVRGLSLTVGHGETHCLVGESGCGKSLSALAIMRLLPRGAESQAAHIRFGSIDLGKLPEHDMAKLRGERIAMIFQDPMTSLDPAYTVGSQMTEGMRRHYRTAKHVATDRAASLLGRVGITAPELRLAQYPHQLSGGLRQRVMIAMALMCDPQLLIADEPTTALDVTVQAQILRLLHDLQAEFGLGLLLITHDLGVVARVAHRVSVMYAGEIVESGDAAQVFARPMHPYTIGLMDCIPAPGRVKRGGMLGTIPGSVPRVQPGFAGCAFRSRCPHAAPVCESDAPLQDAGAGHRYRCRLRPDWRRDAAS